MFKGRLFRRLIVNDENKINAPNKILDVNFPFVGKISPVNKEKLKFIWLTLAENQPLCIHCGHNDMSNPIEVKSKQHSKCNNLGKLTDVEWPLRGICYGFRPKNLF